MLETIVLFIALFIASITDIKKREIPLPLFPATFVYCIAKRLYFKELLPEQLIVFTVIFLICMISAFRGKMGGGDVLMLSCTGFVLGLYRSFYFFTFLFFTIGIYTFIKRKMVKKIAIAPFVFLSYVLLIVLEAVMVHWHS